MYKRQVCACEDVGLAYPMIIPIVKAAVDAAMQVGLPEAALPLSDAVILVATAPKSNTGALAVWDAMGDLQAGRSGPVSYTHLVRLDLPDDVIFRRRDEVIEAVYRVNDRELSPLPRFMGEKLA